MTIEDRLERIAVALETLVQLQQGVETKPDPAPKTTKKKTTKKKAAKAPEPDPEDDLDGDDSEDDLLGDEDDDGPEVTMRDLQAAGKKYLTDKGGPALRDLLKGYGAARISEVAEDDFKAVLRALTS